MVLSFTISNEQIKLQDRNNGHSSETSFQYPGPLQVGIKKTCTHDVSLMNVEGRMLVETDINFRATEEIGVLVCIQQVQNPGCMVFNADENFALNCSPEITDVIFIQSHIPFSHKYADRSYVKRIDLFLPQKEAERLLNNELLNKLDEHDMISLKSETKNKRLGELLDNIGRKLNTEQLCKHLHEMIVCLNEIGKWKSRF